MCKLVRRIVQLEVGYLCPLLCRVQRDGLWLREGSGFNPMMHSGQANLGNIQCRGAVQDLTVATCF